jgi:D-alanyl-D-alanine carboxypeptidase
MDNKYKWKIITVLVLSICILLSLGYLQISKNSAAKEAAATPTPTAAAEPTATPTAMPTPTATATPEATVDLDTDDSINRLVNQAYPIRSDYVPDDLVVPNVTNNDNQELRSEAAGKLEEMFAAAQDQNIYLKLVSGYRDYTLQTSLYNTYVNKYGAAYANMLDDHPGASEHQLGLAADIGWYNGQCEIQSCFATYPQYTWLEENSYLYGWIIRYPEGKQEVTKIIYSPWHFRYVGIEEATKIHDSGLTMEEYYNRSAG